MDELWTFALRLRERQDSCRLTLVGVTSGCGPTLQDAADDLVSRLLSLVAALRASGFRVPHALGRPDPRVLRFLDELGEIAAHGEDIRDRLFCAAHDLAA